VAALSVFQLTSSKLDLQQLDCKELDVTTAKRTQSDDKHESRKKGDFLRSRLLCERCWTTPLLERPAKVNRVSCEQIQERNKDVQR